MAEEEWETILGRKFCSGHFFEKRNPKTLALHCLRGQDICCHFCELKPCPSECKASTAGEYFSQCNGSISPRMAKKVWSKMNELERRTWLKFTERIREEEGKSKDDRDT